MEVKPLSIQIKEIDAQVRRILRPIDTAKQPKIVRDALTDLRQVLGDARIYANDYELSETREEQLGNSKWAKHYLDKATKDILAASSYDIFSAVDVAQLSATIEQIKADLK